MAGWLDERADDKYDDRWSHLWIQGGDGDESSSLHDLGDIESRVSTNYEVAVGSEANMRSVELSRRVDRRT